MLELEAIRGEAIEILITGLESADVIGKLWIIQQGKILEYQAIESEEGN